MGTQELYSKFQQLLINVFFSISIKSPDPAVVSLVFFFFEGLHWFPLLTGNSKSHNNSLKNEM